MSRVLRTTRRPSRGLRAQLVAVLICLLAAGSPLAAPPDAGPVGPAGPADSVDSVDSVDPAESAGWRLARVDVELAALESLLTSAYFRTALAVAGATRQLLAGAPDEAAVAQRRVRLELMAATAELALRRPRAARRSLMRALRADPELTLDEAEASPRVVAALREVRRQLRTGEATR